MTLRLKSYFQAEGTATGADWDDIFDSVPMLKSEDPDGASAVAGYIDTTTTWSNAGAKLWSFRNNGVEKAYVDRGGKFVGSSFDGNGSALTALDAGAIATGLLATARGGTGLDASAAADGELLIGNGAGGFALATLTAGTNITITNGAGTITIDAAGIPASPSNPNLSYQFNNSSAFGGGTLYEAGSGVVGVGGITSSFPGLFGTGGILKIMLADNSGPGTLDTGKLLIASDVILTRQAAATLQLGDNAAGAPVSQALQVQGSRGGTDSNVSGGSLTISSGQGTGNSQPSTISFATPTRGASSTTAQTMATRLTVEDVAVTAVVPFRAVLPAITAQFAAVYAQAEWNNAGVDFSLISCDVIGTANGPGSMLLNLMYAAATVFSIDYQGFPGWTQEATGAGTPTFGTNCPAVTATAPYTWLKAHSSDGSVVYIPAWK